MSYKVLVIDDEEHIVRLIKKFLTKNFGYEVDVAYDGDEGLELIKERKYSLVISDIRMPKLDGITLLEKKNEFDPFLPVILITGKSNFENLLAAMKNGANNYLMKPFSLRELGEAVTKAIDFYQTTLEPKHLWGDMEGMVKTRKLELEIPTSLPAVKKVSTYLMEMARFHGFDEKETQDIFISLNEILANAVEHGNLELIGEKDEAYYVEQEKRLGNPEFSSRKVRVEAVFDEDTAEFDIIDEGRGFNFCLVESCLDPENIIRNSGRGIFLATCFMDTLDYTEPGNRVKMKKVKTRC